MTDNRTALTTAGSDMQPANVTGKAIPATAKYPRRTVHSVIKYCRDNYGFVVDPDHRDEDILLPGDALATLGISTIFSGQSVECEAVRGPSGWRVDKIRLSGEILKYPINPYALLFDAGVRDIGELRKTSRFVSGELMEVAETFKEGKSGFLRPIKDDVGAGKQLGYSRYVNFTGYTFNCAGVVPFHLEAGQRYLVDYYEIDEGRPFAVAVRRVDEEGRPLAIPSTNPPPGTDTEKAELSAAADIAKLYVQVATELLEKAVPRIIDAILSRFKVVLPDSANATALSRDEIIEVIGSLVGRSKSAEAPAVEPKVKKVPELSERQKRRQRRLDSFPKQDELKPLIDKLAGETPPVTTIGELVDKLKSAGKAVSSNAMAEIEAIFDKPLTALNLRNEKTIKVTSFAVLLAEGCGMSADDAFAVIKGKVEAVRREIADLLAERGPALGLPKSPRAALEKLMAPEQEEGSNAVPADDAGTGATSFPNLLKTALAAQSPEFAAQPDEAGFRNFATNLLQQQGTSPFALAQLPLMVRLFNGDLSPVGDGGAIIAPAQSLIDRLGIPKEEVEKLTRFSSRPADSAPEITVAAARPSPKVM